MPTILGFATPETSIRIRDQTLQPARRKNGCPNSPCIICSRNTPKANIFAEDCQMSRPPGHHPATSFRGEQSRSGRFFELRPKTTSPEKWFNHVWKKLATDTRQSPKTGRPPKARPGFKPSNPCPSVFIRGKRFPIRFQLSWLALVAPTPQRNGSGLRWKREKKADQASVAVAPAHPPVQAQRQTLAALSLEVFSPFCGIAGLPQICLNRVSRRSGKRMQRSLNWRFKRVDQKPRNAKWGDV